MKPVPEVGKYYHFFDDGKTGAGRHYIARVERILTKEDIKNIYPLPDNPETSLYEIWEGEVDGNEWLYSMDTDYIIEASCPKYDEVNNLFFVRTKDGGWFSMDVQDWWQSGRLDVTGEMYESIIKDRKEHGYDTESYTKVTY